MRHRSKRRQCSAQHGGAGARAAASVRGGERLVQVDVHGVDAEVARFRLAHDGVQVGSVAVEEAARRMHVHYNTLKNRLERVEAILGPVLDDPARALECEVAIHVARHYDVPQSEPAHRRR